MPIIPAASPRWISDRKSTRLNSSHGYISYAVFCLKKKKNTLRERFVEQEVDQRGEDDDDGDAHCGEEQRHLERGPEFLRAEDPSIVLDYDEAEEARALQIVVMEAEPGRIDNRIADQQDDREQGRHIEQEGERGLGQPPANHTSGHCASPSGTARL